MSREPRHIGAELDITNCPEMSEDAFHQRIIRPSEIAVLKRCPEGYRFVPSALSIPSAGAERAEELPSGVRFMVFRYVDDARRQRVIARADALFEDCTS